MKVIPAYTLIILCMLFIVLHSCLISEHDRREQFSINLRWIKGFDGESSDNMMTGLAWNLSFLGAKVPAGSMKAAVHWTNQSVFSLNLSEVVFPKKVEVTIVSILNDLKRSDEYARHGSFDLGRFIALLLTSSNYYYAITDVPRTYKEFRLQFTFSDTLAAIVESGIAHGNRLIEISESKTLNDIAFIAHEGKGSLQNQSFRASEF